MNKILASLFCFLAITTPSYSITFFHEDGTPVKIEELRDGEKTHPDVCCVDILGKGHGTGVFLSPNLVMTARHVVCRGKNIGENRGPNNQIIFPASYKDLISPTEFISIIIRGRSFSVDRIELFEDGHEDIALVILKSRFNELANFRPVKANLQGTNVPEVSVMGYGNGRVVFEGDRKFAELDDLHALFRLQLRYRNNIKPPAGQSFTVERSPIVPLWNGIAKTYKHDREYPRLNLLSRNVMLMCGDSGGPLLNEKDEIIGVSSYGHEEVIGPEMELCKVYSKALMLRQCKYAALKYALAIAVCCYAFYIEHDTKWPILLASRLMPAFLLITQIMEYVPPLSYATGYYKRHFKRKDYEAVWSDQNSKFVNRIKQDNKLLSSKFVCFRQDTVDWINGVILANVVRY